MGAETLREEDLEEGMGRNEFMQDILQMAIDPDSGLYREYQNVIKNMTEKLFAERLSEFGNQHEKNNVDVLCKHLETGRIFVGKMLNIGNLAEPAKKIKLYNQKKEFVICLNELRGWEIYIPEQVCDFGIEEISRQGIRKIMEGIPVAVLRIFK